MDPRRAMLTGAGFCFLGLGVLGIFLPVLPTTPFLLLAAGCWMRSSERFYRRLITNRWLGSYIVNYREKKGITALQKTVTLAALWVGIGSTAIFVVERLWVSLLLFAIAIGVTVHILVIKTLPGRSAHGQEEPAVRPPEPPGA